MAKNCNRSEFLSDWNWVVDDHGIVKICFIAIFNGDGIQLGRILGQILALEESGQRFEHVHEDS